MTEPQRAKPSKDEDLEVGLNVGSGVGIGIGTVVFAITGEAFWFALGPVFSSSRS